MPTARLSLAQPIQSRNGTFASDSYTANFIFENKGEHKEVVKRPGLVALTQVASVSPPSYLQAQGLVDFSGNLVAVISNTVYQINPASSYAVTTLGTISGASNQCYFAKTIGDTYVFFHNKANAYLYNPSGSSVSMTGLPTGTPYASGCVFLDNYIFIADNNNTIWNCNLGDPTTWNALDYISFEQTSDKLVGIAKHLNYLIAFGYKSLQFFYDAANATGSPLGLADSYTSEIGCANGDSIAQTNNTVFWIGSSQSGGRAVYMLDGVMPRRMSTDSIDKHLEASNLSQVSAYTYTFNGHILYILTLHDLNQTLVYDITEKEWYTWTQYAIQSTGQPNAGAYAESYFRPTFYALLNDVQYLLDDDTAYLYQLSASSYLDNGQPIYCRSVTSLLDNGTTKRKFYRRLEAVGDTSSGGVIFASYTQDDYNTWSMARQINLASKRPQIYMAGAGRRRAYQFLCIDNVPMRLEAIEVDFDIGEMDQSQNVGASQQQRK
jgi:hypothetical protein